MKLITTNEQLTALLPNIAVSVEGEMPLIDKLTPFLNTVEKWISDAFTSGSVFNDITTLPEDNELRVATTQVVVYEAFRRALPHLDVILTPNGFGIVSNSNIVPASKERITRLLDALLDNRDAAIAQLLDILSQQSDWLATSQAEFFRATMFPNIALAERFPRSSEGRWEQYLTLREKAILMEEFFATQYLSKELLEVLRTETQSGQYRSMLHQRICRILRAVEVRCLLSSEPSEAMHFEHGALTDIVNTIRDNPERFSEWHGSETAKLYDPPVFENEKSAKGYWF